MNELEKRAKRSREACQVLQNPTAAYDEIQSLRQQLEKAQSKRDAALGRVAELEDCLGEGLEVWERYLCTGGGSPVAHREFIGQARKFNAEAKRLRNQAEAENAGGGQ